ncbi:MAG: solute:sodium symporter family transporter, partial [Akkermansiaceae bacterium]|nr:solute:sodium symporter family transporter [Akkermansiaceae bacterium]
NFFYWTTNQQIIQRTFGARSLAEGQKGVLLASFFKILAPIILIFPGIIALHIFTVNPPEGVDARAMMETDGKVYGTLVRTVLPGWLTGFFAAVVMGSILSTFNSVLNSSATLFSLGVYKKILKPEATQHQLVRSGRVCSAVVAVFAVVSAPLVFMNVEGIFGYFQKLNGIYFIPLLAMVMFGFFNRTADGRTAVITVVVGLIAMVIGTFIAADPINRALGSGYHYMGLVFALLLLLQFVLGQSMKHPAPHVQKDARAVDLTPWKFAKPVGIGLIIFVLVLYALFADFGTLSG